MVSALVCVALCSSCVVHSFCVCVRVVFVLCCAGFLRLCVCCCVCVVVSMVLAFMHVFLCLFCVVHGFCVCVRAVCCLVSAFVRVQLCLCRAVHDQLSLLHVHLAPSGFALAPRHFVSEVIFICPVVVCANICKT